MNFDFRFYWRLMLRRLPTMMIIIIICSALGFIQAVRLPATYTTEARLLVEAARIDTNNADSLADEQIQIIRERLLTRANLLDIANEFDVLEDYSALPPDTIVRIMQANTQIINRGGRDRATVITVAFSARSGQIAADVVNEYVTRIIDASVAVTTGAAEDRLEFYEQEVERLSGLLSSRSAAISQFQAENADALPGNQEFRLSRQAVLQERTGSAQRELSSLIDQRARIIEIYELGGRVPTDEGSLTEDQRQLRDLERELAQLLTIYSDTAPQIVTMQRRIDQLRAQVAATGSPNDSITPGQAVLDLQLAQIDDQILELESIISEAESELVQLEDAIARTPLNAITMGSMERDYETVRAQYDNAVALLAEADENVRVTLRQFGQRITLTEPATAPRSPTSPNRKLIAFFGGVIGVGLAAGLFVLLELLNRTVRRPAEISSALGIAPLVTIPYIETRREKFLRVTTRAVAMVMIIAGLPAILWWVDQNYLPLDQLAGEILSRLGLA